jgi:hypothetical protein
MTLPERELAWVPTSVLVEELVRDWFIVVCDAVDDELLEAVVLNCPLIELPVSVVAWLEPAKLVLLLDWLWLLATCVVELAWVTVVVEVKSPLIDPAVRTLVCVVEALVVADTVSEPLVVVPNDVAVEASVAVVVALPWISCPVSRLECASAAKVVAVTCCV